MVWCPFNSQGSQQSSRRLPRMKVHACLCAGVFPVWHQLQVPTAMQRDLSSLVLLEPHQAATLSTLSLWNPHSAAQCRDWYSEASQPGKKKGVWVGWRKASRGIEVSTVTFSWYQKLGTWKKRSSERRSRCQGPEAAPLSSTVPVAEPGACQL